jgi:hypothetical protein
MRTRAVAPLLLVVSTTLATPGLARAEPSGVTAVPAAPATRAIGGDVVHLKGGGMLRGTLVEILPNDHVTVGLANGQTASVPWLQVLRIERGVDAPPASTSGPSAAPAGPRALVHIESERPLRLEVLEPPRKFHFVCASPCDVQVDLNATYRIVGDGVRATSSFQLQARPGQAVLVEVDTSSKAGFVGGIVLTSVAFPVALVGLVVAVMGGAVNSGGATTAGTALGLGGLAGGIGGIFLITGNARSSQTQSPLVPAPAAAARSAAFEGAPAFPAARTVSVPVLTF